MILKDYIKGLRELVKNNPEAAKFEVIYAVDEEGNRFEPVYFGGTMGNFQNNDFLDIASIEELIKDEGEKEDYTTRKETKMNKYAVTITATVTKVIEVEAINENEAEILAHECFTASPDDYPEKYTENVDSIKEIK